MASGTVFDLQPFSVHDGPGIRTLIFLKGCPLACVWCCNPESQARGPELLFEAARCVACLACAGACAAMGVRSGRPVPDRGACAGCRSWDCVGACPQAVWRRTGEVMTAADAVAEAARDADFFRNSGGGVTFSGGEPFAQPDFLLEALALCRARGLHTAVETCGVARRSDLEAAEPLVDLFLYDVKVVDPDRHQALTGAGNAGLLGNLAWLARTAPEKVVVRRPLVPGLTDDPGDLAALADLMTDLGLGRLELEPYHPLGEAKYAALGRDCPCHADPRRLDLDGLLGCFRERGLEASLA